MPAANYVVTVLGLGDSIWNGFGAAPAAGPRSAAYFALKAMGLPIWWLGNPVLANGGTGPSGNPAGVLAIDPFNDGLVGAPIPRAPNDASSAFAPDLCCLQGGNNNITGGQTTNQVIDAYSTYLDSVWISMRKPWREMLAHQITKRIDGLNHIVQEVNAALPALVASKPYADQVTILPCENVVPDADYDDAVHFNNVGADLYGELVAEFLAPMVTRVRGSKQGG